MGREDIIKILGNYKKKYAKKYGIIELGLFGSYARNEAGQDSDIDICVKTIVPDPFILAHIKEDIEKISNLKVDVLRIREGMNPVLKERISREGIYV
ncbi:MAG: nucleotidyltransferase domain-containing protein [Oligoflexia bacterium]|nr:nucleotidyltransferase domain-containing protein [Oligoflexia bacterium]